VQGLFLIGIALAIAHALIKGKGTESDEPPVELNFNRGLSVISSSSHKSDWDGYIIPHIVAASQTNKVFVTLWHMKKEAYAEIGRASCRERVCLQV
jgi:hypothetical protein